MAELKHPPTVEEEELRLLDPDEFPPPRGTKLLIYTVTGLIIVGPWTDDGYCLLWMHCPRVDQARVESLRQRNKDRGKRWY